MASAAQEYLLEIWLLGPPSRFTKKNPHGCSFGFFPPNKPSRWVWYARMWEPLHRSNRGLLLFSNESALHIRWPKYSGVLYLDPENFKTKWLELASWSQINRVVRTSLESGCSNVNQWSMFSQGRIVESMERASLGQQDLNTEDSLMPGSKGKTIRNQTRRPDIHITNSTWKSLRSP